MLLKAALNAYILALLLIPVSSGHPFHTFSIYKKRMMALHAFLPTAVV